jgi:hypothetical protein
VNRLVDSLWITGLFGILAGCIVTAREVVLLMSS